MNKTEQNNICAVIPAAGESSRMDSYKPLLRFDNGRTFIEKIVHEFLNFGCGEIIVVVNEEIYNDAWDNILSKFDSKVNVIINRRLHFERFYSIKLGLEKLKNRQASFIHNCDNPFINQGILSAIFRNRFSEGSVSPVYNNSGGHPILISKPIIENIIHSKENDANFRDIIHLFPSKKINIDDKDVLTNINTQLEYREFLNSKSRTN